MRFAASVMALRARPLDAKHLALAAEGDTEQEAAAQAMAFAMRWWPASEGYFFHSVSTAVLGGEEEGQGEAREAEEARPHSPHAVEARLGAAVP